MAATRLLFASIHSYLDPSSGAAMASREVLELLAARGWDCRALTCGVLDYQRETPIEDVLDTMDLGSVSARGPLRRVSCAPPVQMSLSPFRPYPGGSPMAADDISKPDSRRKADELAIAADLAGIESRLVDVQEYPP